MEPEEQIYVNIEELGGFSAKHQGPEETETKPVRTEAVARGETETWSPSKVASVCLGLLCFLLLTTVIAVGALYDRDFNQLSRDLADNTAEKDQLLVRYQNLTDERDQLHTRYQNLTDERDQLQTSFKSVVHELNEVKKNMETCPDGWRKFGCSCYFLSTRSASWATSRQMCLNEGADLVITDSQAEMVFLNKLGAQKFWIGLKKSSGQYNWKWTNGRSPTTEYWYRYSSYYTHGTQERCAAFNSFVYSWRVNSWTSETCDHHLQWMCESQAEMPLLS